MKVADILIVSCVILFFPLFQFLPNAEASFHIREEQATGQNPLRKDFHLMIHLPNNCVPISRTELSDTLIFAQWCHFPFLTCTLPNSEKFSHFSHRENRKTQKFRLCIADSLTAVLCLIWLQNGHIGPRSGPL